MRVSVRLQLLTCLVLYASSAHAIMVKFGTKGGPIEPEVPVPTVPPSKPYRSPAPVWEERTNDSPDPNANWRPQPFIPQPRYTQVIYPGQPQTQNNAKQFVDAYIPRNPQPIPAEPQNYFTPAQFVSQLSSQSLPGIGLRYFVPYFITEKQQQEEQKKRQEDAKLNEIENNEVNNHYEVSSDAQWRQEKESAKRATRQSAEGSVASYVYQWPAYVPHRQ